MHVFTTVFKSILYLPWVNYEMACYHTKQHFQHNEFSCFFSHKQEYYGQADKQQKSDFFVAAYVGNTKIRKQT